MITTLVTVCARGIYSVYVKPVAQISIVMFPHFLAILTTKPSQISHSSQIKLAFKQGLVTEYFPLVCSAEGEEKQENVFFCSKFLY